MLNPDTRLKRRPDLLATGMGKEVVMLDADSGSYFGLSGVGPQVWELLDQPRTVGDVVEAVKTAFSVGPEDSVDRDVQLFLQALLDKGLVSVVD